MSLIFLFMGLPSAQASMMTSFERGTAYGDAVYELNEKLAVWENGESPAEKNALNALRSSFSSLIGSSAPYSIWFVRYIDVLIHIVYYDFDAISDLLNEIKMKTDFCNHLEDIHSVYLHIGNIVQLENYAIGRIAEYNREDTINDELALAYCQQAIAAYAKCNGWLDSAQRHTALRIDEQDLKKKVAQSYFDAGVFLMNSTRDSDPAAYQNYVNAYSYFQKSQNVNCQVYLEQIKLKLGYTPASADDYLEAPKGLQLTEQSMNSGCLSWDSAKHTAGYIVYYREKGNAGWTSIQLNGNTKTSVEIGNLIQGRDYEFKVTSFSGEIRRETDVVVFHFGGYLRVGNRLEFGRYPQSANGGQKPIEWVVLSISDNGETATMISQYILDVQVWNDQDIQVAWGSSYIRNWLNNTFYTRAFTAGERQAIVLTLISNSYDYVFLLNKSQAEQYLGKPVPGAAATDYARNLGVWYDRDRGGVCSWWLRSDASSYGQDDYGRWYYFIDIVSTQRGVQRNKVTETDNGIRPVVVVNTKECLTYGRILNQ